MSSTKKKPRTVARKLATSVEEDYPESVPVHKTEPPNMDATETDLAIIGKIAKRAYKQAKQVLGKLLTRDALDYHMDITAVHLNGCPLRLADLLKADDFNFAHDITGIARCLDRETGKLKDFFVPRFAKRRD